MKQNKTIFWILIGTFFLLYAFVAFVSTLHAISFFGLTNVAWMAVLLAVAYEIGQATVLFAILATDNKKNILPWIMMIVLTSVQVIGNVYSSFKFMDSSGSDDWTYWQRSILFWMEADGPEMFKVVISWITGALLPIVALGMTALVAENLKLMNEQDKKDKEEKKLIDNSKKINISNIDNEIHEEFADELLKPENQSVNLPKYNTTDYAAEVVNDSLIISGISGNDSESHEKIFVDEIPEEKLSVNPRGKKITKKPVNSPRGWHLKMWHVDDNGDVYKYGKYMPDIKDIGNLPGKEINPPKKVQG